MSRKGSDKLIELATYLDDSALKTEKTRVEIPLYQGRLDVHLGVGLQPRYPRPYEFFQTAQYSDDEDYVLCAGLTLEIPLHTRLTFLIEETPDLLVPLLPWARTYRVNPAINMYGEGFICAIEEVAVNDPKRDWLEPFYEASKSALYHQWMCLIPDPQNERYQIMSSDCHNALEQDVVWPEWGLHKVLHAAGEWCIRDWDHPLFKFLRHEVRTASVATIYPRC